LSPPETPTQTATDTPHAPDPAPASPLEPHQGRGFLRAFAVVLATLLLATAAGSVALDPTGLFGLRLVPPAEQTSRDDKAALFLARPSPTEIAVLGSSRAWCLEPERITARSGEAAFNFGVDTATTDDLLAILRFALDRGKGKLRRVLLAMEPEMFSDKRDRTSRLDYARALRPYAAPGAITPMGILGGELLLGPTTLEGDKRSLRRLFFERDRLPKYAFDAGGAADWPRFDDERSRHTFDFEKNLAESVAVAELYARRFDALSPRRRAAFEAFLDLARERGVVVLAFVPPIFPAAWSTLGKTKLAARYADMEALLDAHAREGRLRLLAPRRLTLDAFDADPTGFYDHLHMTRDNGRKLVRFLLDRAAP
jgi:hypothetical protein